MSGRVESYADLAAAVLATPPRLGRVRLVAVDGPAGSGKTTFAGRLAAALRARAASVGEVHTDDLLNGWVDIVAFWPRLERWILEPLRRGEAGRYQAYDWHAARFDEQWRAVPVPDVLIVEGVTSARAAAQPYLGLGILVDADRDLRLARGIARDGEAMRGEWVRWMADEDRHFAADDTRSRANIVVDGAPTLPHDPEREYVALLKRA